jgi:hypothetical protein
LASISLPLPSSLSTLTWHQASDCIIAVKWVPVGLLILLVAAVNSCTTLVNRRDLYSPEPGPDSRETMQRMAGNTPAAAATTTATTTTTAPIGGSTPPPPPPEFRY